MDIFPPSSGSPSPGLLLFDNTYDPPLPVPLHVGDADLDGFPDILLILVTGRGSTRPRTPKLITNVPCAPGVAGCSGKASRGWKAAVKGVDALENVKDARGVAFLDVDEDVSWVAAIKERDAHR